MKRKPLLVPFVVGLVLCAVALGARGIGGEDAVDATRVLWMIGLAILALGLVLLVVYALVRFVVWASR